MAAASFSFEVATRGKGTTEITGRIEDGLARAGIDTGTVTVFVRR